LEVAARMAPPQAAFAHFRPVLSGREDKRHNDESAN
jgi:hypothetical protein